MPEATSPTTQDRADLTNPLPDFRETTGMESESEGDFPPEPKVVDGTFAIHLAKNGMNAHLEVTLPINGGQGVTLADVLAKAKELGIVPEKISQAVIETALIKGEIKQLLIAQGTPPKAGEQTRFIPLVKARERRPQMDAQGKVDFRNLGDIPVVQPGERLMQRIPAIPGENGETVTGLVITARSFKDEPFEKNLAGVSQDPTDPNFLIATLSGQPMLEFQGVWVDPVFTVTQVNMQSGNIVFDGTVKIVGDVLSGMTVRATGDIFVGGTVESATLDAGGDIIIKAGLLGKVEEGKAVLKHQPHPKATCKGSLHARFAQGATIEAGGGIYIDDTAMHCKLIAEKEIIVGRSGKGLVVHGLCKAKYRVKVKNIGSHHGSRTIVHVGDDPKIQSEYKKLCDTLEVWEQKKAALMRYLERAALEPHKTTQSVLEKAHATLEMIAQEMATLSEAKANIQAEIDALSAAQIIALEKIHSGSELRFGPFFFPLSHSHEGSTLILKEGVMIKV